MVHAITGKCLVTGGFGYLARAIYRRAEQENWDCEFTALGRHEDAATKLHQRFPDVRCVLGDVRNLTRLTDLARGHDIIVHAAAMKRVPESEQNVCETVDINIQGSLSVAMAAHAAGVKRVVGISTDKAVAPCNLYGMTKAVMERIFGEANSWGPTRFMVTRYGNVVGSTGSIVPVFREMLRRDGFVKVTDPTMTRFWLCPDEAVDLVSACVEMAGSRAGDLLVPLPGAMKIGDLARAIVGDSPMAIKIVGRRPGEKLHEALLSDVEASRSEWYPVADRPCVVVHARDSVEGGSRVGGYSSDVPNRWIDALEMAAMIEDAATI